MKKIKTFLTIDTFETFGMISFTSGTENTSLDHLTTFAAFFKRLKWRFRLLWFVVYEIWMCLGMIGVHGTYGFIAALAVWIISIHNNKFTAMKVLIAFEANETFDMKIVAHCLNKTLSRWPIIMVFPIITVFPCKIFEYGILSCAIDGHLGEVWLKLFWWQAT